MKKRGMISVLLIAALLLGGCRGAGRQAADIRYESAAKSTAYENSGSAALSEGLWMEEAVEEKAAMEAEEADLGGGKEDTSFARKIVWTGNLRVESTEYEKTLQEIRDLFDRFDVQIQESEEYDRGDSYGSERKSLRAMSWTIRIPSENFQAFFDSTGSLSGQIRSKSTSSSDRTREYNNTAVQIESLKIQQENLLEMMKQTKSIKDMLAIEDRLTEIRTELQILSGANSQIDYDSEYSRIQVDLQEVAVYHKEEITYLSRLKQAFGDSLIAFAEALGDFGVSLIYAIPYLLILALAFLGGRRIFRRWKLRRQKNENS